MLLPPLFYHWHLYYIKRERVSPACIAAAASKSPTNCTLLKSLKYTEEQVRLVERATTTQRKCEQWYEADSNFQPTLKHSHEYYFQVQGQMAVTTVHVCDFVIWTPSECTIETITFDKMFWNEVCYPPLQIFYFYFLLPEIIYPKYPELPCDYSPFSLYPQWTCVLSFSEHAHKINHMILIFNWNT